MPATSFLFSIILVTLPVSTSLLLFLCLLFSFGVDLAYTLVPSAKDVAKKEMIFINCRQTDFRLILREISVCSNSMNERYKFLFFLVSLENLFRAHNFSRCHLLRQILFFCPLHLLIPCPHAFRYLCI